MGMFFSDNEDDIARRRAENDDKSMFFSESDDDIARRKTLNSDKSLFFSESDDDIARRKALNSDKSLFFSKNCNNIEKGEEMGIFYDNSKKISYEEMYGEINENNETIKKIKRIEKNEKNEIEIHKEFITKAKEMKEIKEKKYYCIIHTGFYNSGNINFKTVILECIDKGTADDINRYISGNYFKTSEIAKEVLNSDVWKNRFLSFRENKEIKREYRKAYYTINFENGESFISTDLGSEDDNENFKSGNYFKTYEEISSFLENGLLNSQNQIKEFAKKLEMKLEIEDDNFTNDEKYKKFKKVNNTSYWRANINEVYFTIKNNIIKAENENSIDIYKNNENYKTGNYFKTYGIAKEVLNSDVWKNRFWDYKKNKEKNDELLEDEIYYTVDDDGVDFNSCFDFFNLKIGNYFKTKAEALNFFENDYPKSIKRIKDFTNELMKKNGYEISGYDLIKKSVK